MKHLILSSVLAACAAAWSADLRPAAMEPLPPDAVRPEGHLLKTLERQRDGLTGHAEELYPDIGQSDWKTNAGRRGEFSWERGPYYARGLVALALVLDDPALKAKAKLWVDAALASQKPDGDIGPRKDNWWANMIPQWYLRDWADATGDARVAPFLAKYYDYQAEELKTVSFEKEGCWACARGGDEIDAVLWLYRKTGEAKWLAFADLIAGYTADWTTYYHDGGDPGFNTRGRGGYRCHIVNFMQGLKYPALRWLMGGTEADRTAYAAAFDPQGWVVRRCGRPDAMVNGSEPLTDRSAAGATELCAIAERINSNRSVLAAFGDAAVADDLEDVAYNALPATVAPDGKGIRYYLMLNQPHCLDKDLMFANNGHGHENTGANCPGPHSGFGCCRSNWHYAAPRFVQSMWMKKDGGLAVVAHGPARVTAEIGGGKVTLREETEYPYSGKVAIRVVEGGGAFPLFVRIPRWAKLPDAGTFRRIDRVWKAGDVVELDFPMAVEVSHWGQDAVCVRRGPLLYSLKMEADWTRVAKYKVPYEKREIVDDGTQAFPRWEIRSKTPWNYALELGADGRLAGAEVKGEGRGTRIFVRARRTADAEGWGHMRADAHGRPEDPPASPVDPRLCGASEILELMPLADTQVRITLFPWTRAESAAGASVLSGNWPAAKDPRSVGRRLVDRFLQKTPEKWTDWKGVLSYPVACAWYGAFEFAAATGNRDLGGRLADRFLPFEGPLKSFVPDPCHVDWSMFGCIPLSAYIHAGDTAARDIGLAMADAQWNEPKVGDKVFNGMFDLAERTRLWKAGYTPQTRLWIDDMFMITIVQLKAYQATGDRRYASRASHEMVLYLDRIQNPDGLFYHAPDVPYVWGRGDGWMASGTAMLLKALPQDDPNRPRILAGYRKMMAALLKHQKPDGTWGQLVDDPASWTETSGTAMFAYAFIEGVKQGWLDAAVYGPAARRAYLALCDYLTPDGDVREVCVGTNKKNDHQYYLDRPRRTGDLHGQAPLLWCCAALVD